MRHIHICRKDAMTSSCQDNLCSREMACQDIKYVNCIQIFYVNNMYVHCPYLTRLHKELPIMHWYVRCTHIYFYWIYIIFLSLYDTFILLASTYTALFTGLWSLYQGPSLGTITNLSGHFFSTLWFWPRTSILYSLLFTWAILKDISQLLFFWTWYT